MFGHGKVGQSILNVVVPYLVMGKRRCYCIISGHGKVSQRCCCIMFGHGRVGQSIFGVVVSCFGHRKVGKNDLGVVLCLAMGELPRLF